MMFRSLAISSSLLALLASGSVMAMGDRDENDRKRNGGAQDSPLGNSSKRVKQEEAKEEKPQPQGINKNLNDMIDAAKQGDVESQYKLGKMYYEGKGVDQDFKEAKKLWEDAAKQGHDKAKLQLGKMLRDGVKDENGQEIIKRDSLRAKELFEEVATADGAEDLGAQRKLGKMLRDGVKDENGQEIVKRNLPEAMDWFEESAKWGDPAAEYELGKILRDGVKDENGQEIVKRNFPEAMAWFILASASEYKDAQFQPKECMKLLEVAVQDGNPDAQFQLWEILRDGVKDKNGKKSVKKDRLNAIKWLKAAADRGHEQAKAALQQLQPQQPQMQPQQPQLRPAVPAAMQQNAFDVRSTWKFNPAELRNATEDEIKLYDEIMGKVEESSITPAEKMKAKNALLRFKTLHANNAAICGELMESLVVRMYSKKIYAVTPGDILIHPEQGDANLEQRAHIIHNILEATYAGVKENQTSLEKFFKEAFSDRIPCLEAQSRKIDDWRASQESIEVKISRQSIVQNIGEHADQLLEEMKKNSETGKKVIEATQDYQMLDMKLQGDSPEIRKASLKHTSQNIARLEKKHEKWLKNNNKYGEMRQTLLATLVGKRAQDGEITESAINDILSGLGWDFGVQG